MSGDFRTPLQRLRAASYADSASGQVFVEQADLRQVLRGVSDEVRGPVIVLRCTAIMEPDATGAAGVRFAPAITQLQPEGNGEFFLPVRNIDGFLRRFEVGQVYVFDLDVVHTRAEQYRETKQSATP